MRYCAGFLVHFKNNSKFNCAWLQDEVGSLGSMESRDLRRILLERRQERVVLFRQWEGSHAEALTLIAQVPGGQN